MLRKIIIQPKKIQQMSLFAAKLCTFFQLTNKFCVYFCEKLNFDELFHRNNVTRRFLQFVKFNILSLREFVLNLYRLSHDIK